VTSIKIISAGGSDHYIETEATMNEGNSGSPLFDLDGEMGFHSSARPAEPGPFILPPQA
jgi:hypothetical protein